jgi:hypothetical protein
MEAILKSFAGHIAALAALVFFLVAGPGGADATTFSKANLNGRYSFELNAWSPLATAAQNSTLGLITFDGGGKVSATFTTVLGGVAPASYNTVVSSSVNGIYSVNADGTGTLNFQGGTTFTMVLDATAGGLAHSVRLLETSRITDGSVIRGVAELQSPVPKIYKAANLKGTFSIEWDLWQADARGTNEFGRVGLITFDGKGHITSNYATDIGTGDVPRQSTFPAGSYAVNADGTGTFTFVNPFGDAITNAFVITNNGKEIRALFTTPYIDNYVYTLRMVKQ